ncbi:Piso0_004099 [Millerozyma farinosa CBS 7064]|uniref:RNA helicase n=1 Tax=Pichia sorbitophila (strain ATCC MYA-4447 / BCRC 22081 / CBS 7064 / NBRC 10061 / NRRL Y-12695) TaxID=559304 RepID=G8YAD8_PICSO|nr:Piso0_004099 [Millerozyma farinosa CBS 7064]CCE84552.1 Piso0_004099 [Millerozyma farinosa CBS 7064]
MSGRRPLSLEDLVTKTLPNEDDGEPVFLTKAQRNALKSLKSTTQKSRPRTNVSVPRKRVHESASGPSTETSSSNRPVKKRVNKEFKFEWDEQEDTSTDYQPLVEYSSRLNKSEMGLEEKHWKDKKLSEMTARDWRIMKEDYSITSRGDVEYPLRSWEESNLPTKLQNILKVELKYLDPSPIQRATIPSALKLKDLVGVAETGSGKTLAYLLPLLSYIMNIDERYLLYEHQLEHNANRPLGLILAPSRELAIQITKEAKKFTDKLGLNVVTIIGGHQYEETVFSIKDGVHIVVATPGRLVDSIERGIIDIGQSFFFVIDEADKMIDMGFEKSLNQIVGYLPGSSSLSGEESEKFKVDRLVTLMFTATLSPTIEKLTKNYLNQPGYIIIGEAGEVVNRIEQKFYYQKGVSSDESLYKERLAQLTKLIKSHVSSHPDYSVIIFSNYKKTCEELSLHLEDERYHNVVIHGSKSQDVRERVIDSFRKRKERILIATDVASRGIDVPNVSLVVNFQMPKKFEEYIHRIGRTGRAGQKGTSFSFIDDSDSEILPELKKYLSKGRIPCPEWLLRHHSTQVSLLNE